MQPHDSGKRSTEGNLDGGWFAEQAAIQNPLQLALASILNMANRKVHIATPGSVVNMSATVKGSGNMAG